MSTANWEIAKQLFYRAIEVAPERRAALLDDACGNDSALRREVESLLDADDEADDFLAERPELPVSINAHEPLWTAHGEATFAPTFVSPRRRAPSDPTVLLGTVLDGIYRLEAVLGRGGMGTVYGARHAVLGDLVAVKVLPAAASADPVWLQRFVREGQAARAVRHPNLVLVHDMRTSADGVTYLVMEHVDGRTLRTRLGEVSRLEPVEAHDILAAIAGALDAAHAAGVVHRDLKPSNIMLGDGGPRTAKLLDLGIAKLREDLDGDAVTELTQPGNVVGTPAYMSPEQWGVIPRDGSFEIDGRSDVYSLAVVAYELLSGRLPFPDGRLDDLRRAHVLAEVPIPDDVDGVSAAAWSVVARALAKDRADRQSSAGEFVADLGEALGVVSSDAPSRRTPMPCAVGARPAVVTTNLPAPATSFVARDREVAEIVAELRREDVRLLTLTGTGGTGKSRLSLRVATEIAGEFPDGVFLVEVSSLADAELVLPAIGRVVGAKDDSSVPPLDGLRRVLATGRRLIVVDNVEHVLAAAPQLAELVAAAPGLKLLVTSRERLRVRAEHEYVVPPLELPSGADGRDVDEVLESGAVTLFVERARAAKPLFEITRQNASAIVEICRRLDGLPLAIELAAARLRMLSAEALLARLDGRLDVLTGGARDLPERQQTMRGALAWSYDLLDDARRTVFERLAVFSGGFTLDAIEVVCGCNDGDGTGLTLIEVLDAVASLVEKSLLVQLDRSDGDVRFRMLDVVREYAHERLVASESDEDARRRHAEYFLEIGEVAAKQLDGAGQSEWLARLDDEHDNLRAALAWWLERDAERCLRLAVAVRLFWHIRGHYTEGRRWLGAALDRCPDAAAPLRVSAFRGLGYLAWRQGDRAALGHFESGVQLAREIDDSQHVGILSHGLGLVAIQSGELALARRYLEESHVAACRIANDRGVANALVALGDVERLEGQLAAARERYEQALDAYRRANYRVGLGVAYINLGMVAFEEGDRAAARNYYLDAIRIDEELGNTEGIGYALDGLAAISARDGAFDRAGRLAGAAEALRDATGYEADPADRAFRERFLSEASAAAGAARFEAWLAEGRRLTVASALSLALS